MPPSTPAPPVGCGDGLLSPAALARLERGVDTDPHPVPDLGDPAAVARWRAATNAAWGEGTVDGEAVHSPAVVAGRPALLAGPAAGPVVLYLHGGGYVTGSPGVAAPITARLAARLRVTSLAYRLAPEDPFPAAVDDAVAAYAELSAAGTPVTVVGDSAGGGIAVAAALEARARALPPPAALVLLCPHLDHAEADGDAAGDAAGQDRRRLTDAYRASAPADHPLLSPLRADLGGLPPTLVQTGTADPLHRQALAFARRARMAGVDVTLDVWVGLWHTWQYHRDLPEADRALAEAVTWVQRTVPAPNGTVRP